MKLVLILNLVLMLVALSCKSTESQNQEFNLSEEAISESVDVGALPLLVAQDVYQSQQDSDTIFRFQIPIGVRDGESAQSTQLDRMLVRIDKNQAPKAIAILNYPGFFQGQLPSGPDIMVDIYQFTNGGTEVSLMTFESAAESAEAFAAQFGDVSKGLENGFIMKQREDKTSATEAIAKMNFAMVEDNFHEIRKFDTIVFDAKHTIPEQLGLPSDEYGLFEKMATGSLTGEASEPIFSGLTIRRLTVAELLKNLQNQKRREKIAETYKDEFSATAPEITEFDSTMDNEIKEEMLQLLRALNGE